jgi:D-lactate dehydratase / protein deglycase
MTEAPTGDMKPQPDPAEQNAFFPSAYSLSHFTAPKSDLSGADYPSPYRGNKRILVIGADERYLLTDNGSFFSTGNHPVETLLPMYHLDKAGFVFDVTTISGNPVKFEFWAMPSEDAEVQGFFDQYSEQFRKPLKLADVIAKGLDDYAAVFIPGGHGALIGLPKSVEVKAALEWAMANDQFVISLCHGPAAFLAVGDSDIFKGYKIVAFPDAMDAQTPDIGYMPGHLTWKFGEELTAIGFEIINSDISGAVHRDRKMLTGDSPLAGNALGRLAAKTLLAEVA